MNVCTVSLTLFSQHIQMLSLVLVFLFEVSENSVFQHIQMLSLVLVFLFEVSENSKVQSLRFRGPITFVFDIAVFFEPQQILCHYLCVFPSSGESFPYIRLFSGSLEYDHSP